MDALLKIPHPSAELNLLLPKVADGDRSALKSLYDMAAPRLFAILLRMVRQREIAEDLLQETFVTVWKKAFQFDPGRGEGQAWLSSIARRKAIDRLRAANREIRDLDAVLDCVEALPHQGDRVDAETRITMKRLRARLKPDVNRAIELCYDVGLTHEEMAQEMKVPLGTAKSWVRRGLTQLKEYMTTS